ncbi:MAG TPA: hypothetical protein VHQ24_02815 [Lachnospiraceae bacterium]|nr:hypothetical protein [Lachnospiraceae bacterium]
MGENIFQKVSSNIYQWQNSVDSATYYVTGNDSREQIRLSDSLLDSNATYVFMKTQVSSPQNLFNYLKVFSSKERFLWLSEETSFRRLTGVRVKGNSVSRLAKFPLGGHYLNLYGGVTQVSVNDEQNAIVFQSNQNLGSTGETTIGHLDTPKMQVPIIGSITMPVSNGTLQLQLDMEDVTFEEIGASLGYFTNRESDSYGMNSYYFSFLRGAVCSAVTVNLNLFDIEDNEKTYISLPSGISYNSGLMTIYGQSIPMKTGTNARLVFNHYPARAGDNPVTFTYLTFEGGYLVDGQDSGKQLKCLCGQSGMEYLLLKAGDILSMNAGQPSSCVGNRFCSQGTTAWMHASTAGLPYYSKPKQGALYQYTSDSSMLSYFDLVSTTVPTDRSFPLIPYNARLNQEENTDWVSKGYQEIEDAAVAAREKVILMKEEVYREENSSQESYSQVSIGQESVSHESTREDSVVQESASQESTSQESVSKERDNQESLGQESVSQEGVNQENLIQSVLFLDPNSKNVITPQGIVAAVNTSDSTYEYLGLASSRDHQGTGSIPLPDIGFTKLQNNFLAAFSSNRLFLVMNDAGLIMGDNGTLQGSVSYQLTLETATIMKQTETEYADTIGKVMDYFSRQGFYGIVYATETLFKNTLLTADPQISVDALTCFYQYCGQLKAEIEGWNFQLSPRSWKDHGTIFLCKYTRDHSIEELVQDVQYWVWPEAAGANGIENTRSQLIGILEEVADDVNSAVKEQRESLYEKLYGIVQDRTWCGCLIFNASVLIHEVPKEMSSILSGIDSKEFFAHHIGFEQGGVMLGDPIILQQSSMFGLINYKNSNDLNSSTEEDFGFITKRLQVLFYNSKVQYFSCLSQLMLNHLFGGSTCKVPLTTGNILNLVGSYQRNVASSGEACEYAFSLQEETTFSLDSIPIDTITMKKARLSFHQDGAVSKATITLAGTMKFYEPEKFDPFGYGDSKCGVTVIDGRVEDTVLSEGYLCYRNLIVVMEEAGETLKFTVNYGSIEFDEPTSQVRELSLVNRFPMKLMGVVAGKEKLPAEEGFLSVNCPLTQQKIEGEWFGLLWRINLGSLGSMMKSSGIELEWLTAWCQPRKEDSKGDHVNPNAGSRPGIYGVDPFLYFGIRMPWGNMSLPLQGIMTLGFQSIQFGINGEGNDLEYYLRLRNFGLRLLGISFPPGCSDIYLFANPDQTASTKLGWYAAYSMEEEKV